MLRCLVLVIASSAATAGLAQSFPVKGKPIRIIVPYAPGGVADLLSRIVGQRLGPLYGTQIVIHNCPGAGGHVGGELTAKSAPDGYTIMLGTTTHNAAYAMYSKLAYSPPKDLRPCAGACRRSPQQFARRGDGASQAGVRESGVQDPAELDRLPVAQPSGQSGRFISNASVTTA